MWKKSVQQICKKKIYNKYVKNIYHKNKKFIQYIQPRNKYKKLEHTQKFTSRFKKNCTYTKIFFFYRICTL